MKTPLAALFVVGLLALPFAAFGVTGYQSDGYGSGGVALRLNVPMGTVLNPGDEVRFRYQTMDDAYVILFNIDTEGYVHILHPQRLDLSVARRAYDVPADDAKLLVSGETGVEFVFGLSVADRAIIDENELAYMQQSQARPSDQRYRIDGDPFIAANIIAGELVRGISHQDQVFLDYTYFFINERVSHPCYLCGECDGSTGDPLCTNVSITANFDTEMPLRYPLRRAYQMVEQGSEAQFEEVAGADGTYSIETGGSDVTVNFYPYGSEVRYMSRPYAYSNWDYYYQDPWYWDPWYSGGYGYPYPSYGWGISIGIGWGWGWGWGGGYYCGGYWGGYYPHYPVHYPGGGYAYSRPEKFKSKYGAKPEQYKSSSLTASRGRATRNDADLRIASRGARSSASKKTAYRSGSSARSKTALASKRTSPQVYRGKTTRVSGTSSRRTTGSVIRGTTGRSTSRSSSRMATSRRSTQSRKFSNQRRSSTTNRSKSAVRSGRSSRSSNRSGVRSSRSSSSRSSRSAVKSSRSSRSSSRSGVRSSRSSRSSSRSAVRSSRSGGSRSSARSGGSRSSGSRGGSRSSKSR